MSTRRNDGSIEAAEIARGISAFENDALFDRKESYDWQAGWLSAAYAMRTQRKFDAAAVTRLPKTRETLHDVYSAIRFILPARAQPNVRRRAHDALIAIDREIDALRSATSATEAAE